MGGFFAVIYGDEFLQFDFGRGHPLVPDRLKVTFELMRDYGLLDLPQVTTVRPFPATAEHVLGFHEKRYIDFVIETCARGYGLLDQGDTPAFPGCLEASLL